ncbi:MAG TPA: hypothetical protein VE035_11490 [Puia sp.]|nr:hypothetical protein [Puia sp.]
MKKNTSDITPFLIKELNSNFPGFLKEDSSYNVVNVLKQQALDTYAIRYTIQVENSTCTVTKGYPELLENLAKFNGERVLIHVFLNKETALIIFSDLDQKSIIGALTN